MATPGKPFIPMVSSTPPPIDDGFEDEEEDDFGSFASAGFGKDLIGSPPTKKPAENDKMKFNFEPIGNNIPGMDPDSPVKASGNGKNEDGDFGNFASFPHSEQKDDGNVNEHEKRNESALKYPPHSGGLFSEFTSKGDSEEETVTKPNGTYHHNHIESSSNNNSAGGNIRVAESNSLNDSPDPNGGDLNEEEQETTDHSFRFRLTNKEDTLDLRQPSPSLGEGNVEDETGGEINWDMQQGAATPSSRSRSPDNSTSGTHTPVTGAQDSASADSLDPSLAIDATSEVLPQLQLSKETEQLENSQDAKSTESIPVSDSQASERVPSNAISSVDTKTLTSDDKSLETLESKSRTKTYSFGDFSSGPDPGLGGPDPGLGGPNPGLGSNNTEVNSSNNVKIASDVDNSRTVHSDDDDDDDENSLGKPEPPAFPDHDHEEEEDDEFGDFGAFSKPSVNVDEDDNEDDFGDFGTFKSTSSGSKEQHLPSSSPSMNKGISAGDFGGFESSVPSSSKSRNDDDFGDFGAFEEPKGSVGGHDDDEFGDFGTFAGGHKEPQKDSDSGFASFQSTSSSAWATSPTKPTQPSFGSTSRIDRVFQTCFPTVSPNSAGLTLPILTDPIELLINTINNETTRKGQKTGTSEKRPKKKGASTTTVCVSVWASLSDLENTQAVRYQWANSGNSKLLLASLGIDSRNILASKKAAGIPIFAANLGMLTPSKPGEKAAEQDDDDTASNDDNNPEPDVPGSSTVSNNITSPTNDEPATKVEFDWSSSGLTNPLDANSLNLDFFTKESKRGGGSSGSAASSKSKSRSGVFSRGWPLFTKSHREQAGEENQGNKIMPKSGTSNTAIAIEGVEHKTSSLTTVGIDVKKSGGNTDDLSNTFELLHPQSVSDNGRNSSVSPRIPVGVLKDDVKTLDNMKSSDTDKSVWGENVKIFGILGTSTSVVNGHQQETFADFSSKVPVNISEYKPHPVQNRRANDSKTILLHQLGTVMFDVPEEGRAKTSELVTPQTTVKNEAPPIDPEILGLAVNLPTPAQPRPNTNKPLDDILKNSSTSTMVTQRNKRDANLSGEAGRVLDGIPNMTFMHAKVLMFPVGPSPLTKLNGDDFSGKKESTL